MSYFLWVEPNGKIYSCIEFPENTKPYTLPGYSLIPVEQKCDPNTHAYKDGQILVIPKKPGEDYIFDCGSFSWIDPRTLDDLKALKWAEIKSHRDREEFGTFIYNGMTFDGDADAQRRLMVYVSVSKTAIAQGTGFSREFTLADNTEVTLQANDFVAIELAKANQVADVFAKAAMLRQQIEAASSKEALEAISW